MNSRTGTLQDIAEEVLSTGVVCLTGGHDITNIPLLTFPASAHSHLEYWRSERLEQLLRHYMQWLSVTSHVHTVACLADLQNASKNVINIIVEAVEKLELRSRGTISTLYFLKPQNKTRSRLLKKLLGLKPSRKHPKIPLFKVVLMKTHQEVFSQIDLCQLTPDFGGTLKYDHLAWLKFHETVAPCISEAESVMKRVPDIKDRVELMQEYEFNSRAVADIQTLLTELSQSYHVAINEARFQETLDRCKQTLLLLDSTEASQKWLTRLHPLHMQHASECVRELYKKLETHRWQLEELWRGIEDNVNVHLHIQKHRERAAEMRKRMMNHYEPLMHEHPCVGTTLSQAELYRTHFTTTLYEPAKELLSQATEILEDVQRLRERTTPPCDVTDILEQLTVALQPFTHKLQGLQDIYVAVHIFHLLFQKAMTWYRKVLKFLPEGLQERTAESANSKVLQMPLEWQVTVQSFLSKHPPPREQHIARLDTEIPPEVDKRLRAQARSLALRLRLLHRLLYSRRLPVKLLSTVFKWKAEIGNSSSASSTPQEKEKSDSKMTAGTTREETAPQEATRTIFFPLSPPPKPARLFDTMTSVSSLSSSETGDMDYINMNLFDQTGLSIDSFTEEEMDSNDNDTRKDNEKKPGGIAKYEKPPKIDIKILSSNQESDSNKTDQPESKTAGNKELSRQSRPGGQTPEHERFIRLTFSPAGTVPSHRKVREADDSMDSEDLAFTFPDVPTGSESGIEVAEPEDPWDSLIDRIKAVSNSNLPSNVKIQCMSHLLSRSKVSEPTPRQKDEFNHHSVRFDQQDRRDGGLRKNMTGFEQFQRHIARKQDTDVRRNQSFAIARDDVRPYNRKQRQEGNIAFNSGGELHVGEAYDRWRNPVPMTLDQRSHFQTRLHEKPSYAVARMRHRLARSLMDLDELDHDQDSSDSFQDVSDRYGQRRFAATNLPRSYGNGTDVRRAGRLPEMESFGSSAYSRWDEDDRGSVYQHSYRNNAAVNSMTRSYEGGLDTLHLAGHKQASSKLTAWRSHEDGLDSMDRHALRSETPFSKQLSGSVEKGLGSEMPSEQRSHIMAGLATGQGKNPYRWRQGIFGERVASPTKVHHKSKEFIAPSFLKPFHSMHNLHMDMGHPVTSGVFPHRRFMDGNSRVITRDLEDQDRLASDSFCENEYLNELRRSSLERLSDEVDQEYMSQDEVESSLQRSQRILMEAEQKLKQRSQKRETTPTDSSPEEDDSATANLKIPLDLESNLAAERIHPDGVEIELPDKEPIQIRVHDNSRDNNADERWEESTIASESPEREHVTSHGLMGDADWDADVSNMSDTHSDVKQLD